MKLNVDSENTIISFNDGADEHEFDAVVDAKMFRTLSDSLYKNKIGSIVREISCNAWDSHIQMGKTNVPFEIHLPTHLDPYFSIRDFGIGLSRDDIEGKIVPITKNVERVSTNGSLEIVEVPLLNADGSIKTRRAKGLYTTMFRSTKDQSNDMIGAFGLGSKTPFAYTDSFAIISIKDGVKYYYSAYVNEGGKPAVKLLQQEETTDPTGVEIKLSVKSQDFGTFATEVQTQLRFLPVKPVITNASVSFNDGFNAGNPDLIIDTPIIKVATNAVSTSYEKRDAEFFVVLGVIGYPLETASLGNKLTNSLARFLKCISYRSALFFNIGEIEVTASREGISYTDRTIDAIVAKLKEAQEQINIIIGEKVQATGTDWEKVVTVNSFDTLSKLYINSGFMVENATLWNGNKLAYDVWKAPVLGVNSARNWSLDLYGESEKGNSFRAKIRDVRNVVADKNTIFFARDTNKRPVARLKEFYNSQENKDLKIHMFDLDAEFSDELIETFSKTLGNVPIQRVSTLPEPKRSLQGKVYVTRTDYTIPTAYRWKPNTSLKASSRVGEEETTKIFDDIEDIEPALYLSSERGIINNIEWYDNVDPYCKVNSIDLLNRIRAVYERQGREFPQVYIFNRRKAEIVKSMHEWRSVDSFIKEFISELPSYTEFMGKMKAADLVVDRIEDWIDETYLKSFINDENFKKFDKKSRGTYIIRLYRILKNRLNNSRYSAIVENFGKYFNEKVIFEPPFLEVINERIEATKNQLALLAPYRTRYAVSHANASIDHCIQYINVMGNFIVDEQKTV